MAMNSKKAGASSYAGGGPSWYYPHAAGDEPASRAACSEGEHLNRLLRTLCGLVPGPDRYTANQTLNEGYE